MATLETLYRWAKFAPDIGNNAELPAGQQFVLEVATGLPRATLAAMAESIQSAADDDGRVAALAPYVRIHGGPHTLGGRPVATLQDYFAVIAGLAGGYNVRELFGAVAHFNSFSGADALFSERRFGGTAFMPPRSAAKDSSETDGP